MRSKAGTASINSGAMKESNRRLVLQTIRAQQRISRRDLAVHTGLTPASVTNLVKELLAEGYLVEAGRGESRNGPRPIFLEVNPMWGYVIGVELTVTDIICVMTDFSARALCRVQTPLDIDAGKEAVLDLLVSTIEGLIGEAGVERDKLRGIGFVSAGPLSTATGEMLAPPNFPGWGRTPIKRIIEERMGLPVWFDKETQAAAFGEYWFGAARESQVLFVCNIFRVGIGGGILLDSKAYRGHMENAGNVGHTKVVLEGELCTCGERGCLETVGDGRAAVRAVRARFAEHPEEFASVGISSPAEIDFGFVVRGADAGLDACREAVTRCARYVGMALANVIRTLAPDAVVLCGEFPDQSRLFVEACLASVASRHNTEQDDVRVYHSGLGPEVAALGGVAIVLDNLGPGAHIS